MARVVQWIVRVGDAMSQLVNVVVFRGHPNESVSGHVWRIASPWYKVIDLLLWFDKDHCKTSYENDYYYAKEYIEQYESNMLK